MAHSNVTFNVQCGSSSKSERLHMSVYQCVVHFTRHSPSALKSWNQFFIKWTSMVIYELNSFVCTIMSKAIIHQQVKTIWKKCFMKKKKKCDSDYLLVLWISKFVTFYFYPSFCTKPNYKKQFKNWLSRNDLM